jgi:hypothetical protein
VGFDGIMTNEHHSAYWNMKPSANLDAAVIKYQAISNLTFWILALWRQVSLIRFALVRLMSKNLCSGT